jgi:hypothetical protein
MPDEEAFNNCDFRNAIPLAGITESPFTFIPDESFGENIYFACDVGNHCEQGMKLQVENNAM